MQEGSQIEIKIGDKEPFIVPAKAEQDWRDWAEQNGKSREIRISPVLSEEKKALVEQLAKKLVTNINTAAEVNTEPAKRGRPKANQ